MKTNLILPVAIAALGLVVGPTLQPAVVSNLPSIGWWTLTIMFIGSGLVPPLALALLASGEHYIAMARSWTLLFLLAIFLISAGVSAPVFATDPRWTTPASYVFFALGCGLVAMLSLLKLRLLRASARKAARAVIETDTNA